MCAEFVVTKSSEVGTSLRVRAWWLVHVRGYRVRRELDEPKATAWGRTQLVHHWILEPRSKC